MREEVLAGIINEGKEWSLHVYCHVSGGLVFGTAGWRNDILHGNMRIVIEALRYGDRELFHAHPEINEAVVKVHFISSHAEYNVFEDWGLVQAYE